MQGRRTYVGRSLVGLLLLAALSILLVACGEDEEEGTPAAGEVEVSLTEWAVEPSVTTVSAGEVTFTATNDGTVAHELVIIRSDLAPDALPVEEGRVPEAEVDVVDEIEEFDSGATESLTLDLEAGSYVLICNIEGHYEQGMRVGFTVE